MAIITISNTGGNWNATGTWVGGVVPGTNDDVVATATSGPLTVTANANALSVNFTNYVNTFSVNSGISLSIGGGSGFVMVAGMTVAPTSTGTLIFNSSTSATSGGQTWPGSLNFAATGNRTYTIGSPWIVLGNLTIRSSLNNSTINVGGNSITVKGNITFGFAGVINTITSTTNIIAAPDALTTCTISTPSLVAGQCIMRCPLTLNGAGNIVFSTPSGSSIELATVTYTAGTVSMSSTTELRWVVASTLAFNGIDLQGNIRFNSSATFTLANSMTISGTLAFGLASNSASAILNGSFITVTGNITTQSAAGGQVISGTTVIIVTGSNSGLNLGGGVASIGGRFGLSLTINSSGTVTFQSAIISYGGAGRTLTYTSGTIAYTSGASGATWTAASASPAYTFNSPGFSFPNFVTSLGPTFGGSSGCNFYTYTCPTGGMTHTFTSGLTYNITNGISLTGLNASRISFVSSVPSTQAIVTVLQGASIDVGYANATDIDSSLGQTVWSYRGTLLRTNNWQQLPTQPKTVFNFNV